MADSAAKDPKPAVDDITGPGRTEKILKPAPAETGMWISARAKWLMRGGLAAVVAAIVGAVLHSGHAPGPRERAENGAREAAGPIGEAAPPAPPPLPAPVAADFAGAHPDGTPFSPGGPGVSEADGLPASGNFSGAAAPQVLQYRTWRVRQHYKAIERQVLAAQAALSAPIAQGGSPGSASTASGTAFAAPALPVMPDAVPGVPPLQPAPGPDTNRQFLDAQRHRPVRNGTLDARFRRPASSHEVFAGSVVPAVLLTGIDSDLPGTVVAQVRQSVDNSLDPAQVLIPQGARLVGVYRSAVAYGQRRVLIVWRRIIFPNGSTLALRGMPGTDAMGRAGFQDQVDNHYGRIFGSAFLMSLLGAGAQLAQPQNGGLLNTPGAEQEAAANLANEMNRVGANLLNKNLGIQPTLRIRPGYLFNVLVTRTMILPPYPRG
ncbi:MAG: TraB/TrbI/VirB10 family type IV secretion system protein [Acidiferrobacteraceae bacterium]